MKAIYMCIGIGIDTDTGAATETNSNSIHARLRSSLALRLRLDLYTSGANPYEIKIQSYNMILFFIIYFAFLKFCILLLTLLFVKLPLIAPLFPPIIAWMSLN